MKYFFKKFGKYLVVLVILLEIPVTYYLASRPTFKETKAAGEAVGIYFSPNQIGLPPNRTAKLILDAKTNRLSFAKIVFNFDTSKVKLSGEISTAPGLATVVKKTSMNEANSSGRVEIVLGLAAASKNNPPTGVIEFAQVPLTSATTQTNQSANINIDNATSQIVDINAYVLPIDSTTQTVVNVNQQSTLTLEPTDDAFIYPTYAGTNYGRDTKLYANGSPTKTSFLKFDLSSLTGKTIDSAKLRLRVCTTTGCNSTAQQELYFVRNNDWSEGSLTYFNRPELTTLIRKLNGGGLGAYVDGDVTAVTKGKEGNRVSYGLYQSYYSDEIGYFSKENSVDHPKLIIVYH